MEDERDDPIGPRAGCWLLALPVLAAAVVVGSYVGILVLGSRGRPAEGAVTRMTFVGCDEALPRVVGRAEAMGLPDIVSEDTPEGFALTARLPADPPSAREIPYTLAARGTFAIRAGVEPDGEILVDTLGVADATLRLDFTVSAKAAVTLTPAATTRMEAWARVHAGEPVSFWLDGTEVGERKLDPESAWDRLDLEPRTGEREASIRRAAEWSLLLDEGPLPCDLTVTAEPAAPAG